MADKPQSKTPDAAQAIDNVVDSLPELLAYVRKTSGALINEINTTDSLIQLGIVVATGLLAYLLCKSLKLPAVVPVPGVPAEPARRSRFGFARQLALPIAWVVLLWIGTAAADRLTMDNNFLRTTATLLNAWIVIRLFAGLAGDSRWTKAFSITAWAIAALYVLHLLHPTIQMLESIAITVGTTRISAYTVISTLVFAFVLLGLAHFVATQAHDRIRAAQTVSPSVQTLIAQSIRIGLLIVAVLFALNAAGIDLTALAFLSGAIGIGIGFGLQAVFSNLVAGIILLLEHSLKVGDFVDLQSGVTGEVREITIRATRVTTNDNVDVLVPNSEFISGRVTSWTLADQYRRLRIPFGVAYGSDKELVRTVILEAASSVPHNLKGVRGRDPQVWLVGFGDSSLNFELVVWLNPGAVKRPGAVNADYCWAIETALRQHNIEIPFPQRDIHIRSNVSNR